MARVPDCRSGGCGFESRHLREVRRQKIAAEPRPPSGPPLSPHRSRLAQGQSTAPTRRAPRFGSGSGYALAARRIVHLATNQEVGGSNPSGRTRENRGNPGTEAGTSRRPLPAPGRVARGAAGLARLAQRESAGFTRRDCPGSIPGLRTVGEPNGEEPGCGPGRSGFDSRHPPQPEVSAGALSGL